MLELHKWAPHKRAKLKCSLKLKLYKFTSAYRGNWKVSCEAARLVSMLWIWCDDACWLCEKESWLRGSIPLPMFSAILLSPLNPMQISEAWSGDCTIPERYISCKFKPFLIDSIWKYRTPKKSRRNITWTLKKPTLKRMLSWL